MTGERVGTSSSSQETIDSKKTQKSDCFTAKKIAKLPTPKNSQKIAQVAALRLVILLQGVSVCLKKSQSTSK